MTDDAPLSRRSVGDELSAVRLITHYSARQIVRFLAGRQRARMGDIMDGTGLVRVTINQNLVSLIKAGVVKISSVEQGVPYYEVDKARIEALLTFLHAYLDGSSRPSSSPE